MRYTVQPVQSAIILVGYMQELAHQWLGGYVCLPWPYRRAEDDEQGVPE